MHKIRKHQRLMTQKEMARERITDMKLRIDSLINGKTSLTKIAHKALTVGRPTEVYAIASLQIFNLETY